MNILELKRLARRYRGDESGDSGGNGGSSDGSDAHFSRQGDSSAYNGATQSATGGWSLGGGDTNSTTTPAAAPAAVINVPNPSDAVGGLVDRFGNPVYSGDTARSIVNGTLTLNAQGQPTAGPSTANTASDGTSIDNIRAMIASGAVNPNDSLPGNPNQTYAQALGVVDYANPAMQGVANLAMMAMPAPMKLGINFAKSMNDGSSFGDALTQAAKDFVTGKAIGAVNQSVGQALGPDTAKVLGDYNKYASYADVFGAKVPTVSAGGIIANQLGLGTSGMTGTNASMTDGVTPSIPVSGWSSGNGQTSQAPMVAPATPTAAPTQITSTPVNASLGDMTAAFNSGYKSHQSHNGA